MVVLQRPGFAYYDGDVRHRDGAVIHASCEGAYSELSVIEGTKALWQPDGSAGVIAH